MAKYRHVYTNFWSDPIIQEEFTPEDKLFYLYLLTNEHTNQVGIYQITKKQMAFELGYSAETTTALLNRFIDHHGLIKYDAVNREIFVMNWAKHNLMKGGKPVLDCVKRDLSEIKSADFIDEAIDSVPKPEIQHLFMQRYESLTNRSTNRTTISGQKEKEKEKEKEKQNQNTVDDDVHSSSINIFSFYENNIGPLTEFKADQLDHMINESSEVLVIEALKLTVLANSKNLRYTQTILTNWANDNITTVEQVEAANNRKENRHGKNQTQTTREYDDGVNF